METRHRVKVSSKFETNKNSRFLTPLCLCVSSLLSRRESALSLPWVSVQHDVFSSGREQLQSADHSHLHAHLTGSTNRWEAVNPDIYNTQQSQKFSTCLGCYSHTVSLSQVCCWTPTLSRLLITWLACCWQRRMTESGQLSFHPPTIWFLLLLLFCFSLTGNSETEQPL